MTDYYSVQLFLVFYFDHRLQIQDLAFEDL